MAWPRQHYTFGRRRVSARSVSQSDTDMYADDWERHKGEHDWRGLGRAPRWYESTCDDGRRPEGCVEGMMSPSGLLRACTVRWAVWLDEAIACVCDLCDPVFGIDLLLSLGASQGDFTPMLPRCGIVGQPVVGGRGELGPVS